MSTLSYHTGDLFKLMWANKDPTALAMVPHVCNNIGAWGAGFVLALSKIAPASLGAGKSPEAAYKMWKRWQDYEAASADELATMDNMQRRWDLEREIKGAHVNQPFALGNVQLVTVGFEKDTELDDVGSYFEVANMIGQDGVRRKGQKRPPIRYGALAECMGKVRDMCIIRRTPPTVKSMENTEIHCPQFGAGLSGGNWDIIEELILELWVDNGINVHVYKYG